MAANKIVQVNLNRQRGSNDLLLQFMRERRVFLAAISEPNLVPDDPGWMASTDGLALITWRGCEPNMDCAPTLRGEGYCVVRWGEMLVCSCYFSPNRTTREFTDWLDGLGVALSPFLGSPAMILGDFNARSIAWDNGVNERGDPLLDWMSGFDFTLLNRGRAPTTFHPRGVSSVDTSWANGRALRRLGDWSVITRAEVFSDHWPIMISLKSDMDEIRRRERIVASLPRWAVARLDRERLESATLAATWAPVPNTLSANQYASRIKEILCDVCDDVMPRSSVVGRVTKPIYWWNPKIAELRGRCISARRKLWRQRNRAPLEIVLNLRAELRNRRKDLRRKIRNAKMRAWGELLQSLEADPWGRPYRMVLKKARAPVTPISKVLPEDTL